MSDAPPFLEVRGAGVRLGEFDALSDISFTLASGSFLSIMGPNGAGKTTLLKAILGLIPLRTGTIAIEGMPPAEYPAEMKGYVPQIKTLDRTFPATAAELVVSGLRPKWPWSIAPGDRERARSALETVRAGHLEDRSVARLSGGELQRIYLARAFIRSPRLILLDEPATGIDASGEDDLFHYLEEYQGRTGATVVMITHDWETTFHHATRLLLLNRRAIGFGDPATASREADLRSAFGHVGHDHEMHVGRHDHHHHD